MADFVLVHGAWHGAWCWKRILPGLWAAGHRAFAVTLTGTGERAHQLSPSITLRTHADDVAAVIEAEVLQQAVLVGHSYAGMVITAVADRSRAFPDQTQRGVRQRRQVTTCAQRAIGRHHRRDARVQHAQKRLDHHRADAREATRKRGRAQKNHGADDLARQRRPTARGMRANQGALQFDPARVATLPRTFIDCTAPALPTIAAMRERVRQEPGWQVLEIVTGHDAMISAPRALLDALLSLASA